MLVLASSSPRRIQLLTEWGYTFERVSAPVSEKLADGISVEQAVLELARQKALAGYRVWLDQRGSDQDWVVGADTLVALGGQILGKPIDEQEAAGMLQALSGKTHQVLTGVAFVSGEQIQDGCNRIIIEAKAEITTVTFRELRDSEIRDYIATGEPMDKAAAYGIQGQAGKFVAEIRGSRTNVIGFPKALVVANLKKRGIFPDK